MLKPEEAFFSDAMSAVALGLAVNERTLLSALVLYWLSLLDERSVDNFVSWQPSRL